MGRSCGDRGDPGDGPAGHGHGHGHGLVLRALSGLSQVVTDDALRRVYLGSFLTYVAAMGFWRVITIYLVDEWDLSVGPVTTCYAALSVAAGIGNLVLLPRLAGRVPMRRLTVVCLLGGAAAMAAVVVP